MLRVGQPARKKTLPKALPAESVAALLAVLEDGPGPPGRADWIERDRALQLVGPLTCAPIGHTTGAWLRRLSDSRCA